MSGLPNNNDFLNEANSNSDTPKKKRRTALEIEQEKYPEYYALNEYERKILVANNYWNVLYGKKIIEVPPSDTHYHKYFDKGCYSRVEEYQKLKKLTFEHDEKLKKYKDKTEVKEIGQKEVIEVVETKKTDNDDNKKEIEPSGDIASPTAVIEVKDTIEVKLAKEELIVEKPVDKTVENTEIKVNKNKKNTNDEQTSLF